MDANGGAARFTHFTFNLKCGIINMRHARYWERSDTIAKIEGVRQLTPHSCRHAYISQMQVPGVDLSSIQSIVGHADVDMTQSYLHAQEGIRQAFAVAFRPLLLLSPRAGRIRQEAIRKFAQAFPIDGHSPEDPDGAACRILPFPQVV